MATSDANPANQGAQNRPEVYQIVEESKTNRPQQPVEMILSDDEDGIVASLLKNDDLLPRILREMVKDGLHECRRVCRKWRDICSMLPVQLQPLTQKDTQNLPNMFPNASDLKFFGKCRNSCFLIPAADQTRHTRCFFSSLTQLTNLKSLTIEAGEVKWLLLEEMPNPFQPLIHLEALEMGGISCVSDLSLLHAVKALTNLTSLRLIRSDRYRSKSKAEPVTELRKLRELDLSAELCVDNNDQVLFPCVSCLTHLGLVDDFSFRTEPAFSFRILKKVREIYASSLRSLSISNCRIDFRARSAWQVLLAFPNVTTLTLQHVFDNSEVAKAVIRQMTQLNNLNLHSVPHPDLNDQEMLSSMRRLKSLRYQPITFFGGPLSETQLPCVSHLTQLTSLATTIMSAKIPFCELTGLVELHCLITNKLDLSNTICRMPLLQSLALTNPIACCLDRPSVLRNLKRLKSIALNMSNDVSGDFFPALGSLPLLTDLVFDCRINEETISCLAEMSVLKSLRELAIRGSAVADPLRFLQQGSLPKLRLFSFLPRIDSEEQRQELRRRLPCLNRITP